MPIKELLSTFLGQAAIVPFAKPAFEQLRQAHENALKRLDKIIEEREERGAKIEISERELT